MHSRMFYIIYVYKYVDICGELKIWNQLNSWIKYIKDSLENIL